MKTAELKDKALDWAVATFRKAARKFDHLDWHVRDVLDDLAEELEKP